MVREERKPTGRLCRSLVGAMLFIPNLLFAPCSAGRAFVPTTTPLIMLAVPDDIAARDEAATCTADERAAMAAIGGSGAG
eukprot:192661-Prymnesium_polylepis.1